jgi:signal transduction histidine kinase
MEEEQLFFTVKTGIKSIVGKDLITDDYIAIFELVKNSFDAHAKNVIITFEVNKIIIADDGKGMSKTELQDKWLALAYSAKKDGSEDIEDKNSSYRDEIQKKRFYAGAKGIGRFSCDRLGKKLTLYSKRKIDGNVNQLNIDWTDFENNDKEDFIKIPVDYNPIEFKTNLFPNNSLSGTILEIDNTLFWDREKIKNLKHSLEKLINPFSEKNDFQIKIICEREKNEDENGLYKSGPNKGKRYNERDKVNGYVKNAVLDILKIKTSHINLKIYDNHIETKIIDRGELIYHIKEPSQYQMLESCDIDLYFLNRAAKVNFTKKMGIEPLNFGSIFLFKNGFRVQPFGETGNDSWGIDFRSQQGYNRTLGTRDLFGKVDIATEKFEQFKEVSSRDGGLVETVGYFELISAFELAHRRLERYVVGVLWGEGFKRKKYFGEGDEGNKIADNYRKGLSEDKDSDNLQIVKSNLGSKLDFIQIIKNLSSNKDIQIINYNKDFVNLINEKIDENQKKFISDLETIASLTEDENLKNNVHLIEENFKKLKKEKEEAEKRAEEEEKKRKEAEEKALEEEKKRKEAEEKAKIQEERRRLAELETLKKEKERAETELAKIKAEQKAREEQEKNKNLSEKLSIETKKNQYLNATRKTLSEDAEQLVHSIDLYVGNASTYANEILSNNNMSNELRDKIYSIKSNIDKALKVSQIIIKSNFDYKHINQRVDLPTYIKEYLEDLSISRRNIVIKTNNLIQKYALINPIDMDIVLDNLVSNSSKAKAKNILVDFHINNKKLEIYFYDDGIGMSEKLINNPKSIFELGVRDSNEKGSGIGMYDVQKRIINMNGSIEFIGNNLKLKGAGFKIEI